MALSNSGSISLSQIQTEYGGSNPIGLNEYYSGGTLVKTNSTSTVITPSCGTSSHSVTSGKTTTTYYLTGWLHSSLCNASGASGAADIISFRNGTFANIGSDSASVAKVSGADLAGNAGTIPSSGAVQFDHYRATNAGTNSPFTCYGCALNYRDAGSGPTGSVLIIVIGDHWASSNNLGGINQPWSGLPYSTITLADRSSGWSASTATNSGQGVSGEINSASVLRNFTQSDYGTIGNFTSITYSCSPPTAFSLSGNWTITFNF